MESVPVFLVAGLLFTLTNPVLWVAQVLLLMGEQKSHSVKKPENG